MQDTEANFENIRYKQVYLNVLKMYFNSYWHIISPVNATGQKMLEDSLTNQEAIVFLTQYPTWNITSSFTYLGCICR